MSHSKKEVEEEVIDYLVEFHKEIVEDFNNIFKIISEKNVRDSREEINKILLKIKKRVDYSIDNWDFELKK